jgi:hypothetical protein
VDKMSIEQQVQLLPFSNSFHYLVEQVIKKYHPPPISKPESPRQLQMGRKSTTQELDFFQKLQENIWPENKDHDV